MKIVFRFRNETPGALRYEEIDSKGRVLRDDASGKVVGTLYIRKTALAEPPDYLTLTLEGGVDVGEFKLRA